MLGLAPLVPAFAKLKAVAPPPKLKPAPKEINWDGIDDELIAIWCDANREQFAYIARFMIAQEEMRNQISRRVYILPPDPENSRAKLKRWLDKHIDLSPWRLPRP